MPAGVNPADINFQFCHMFSGRAEILSPKRGDVMQSFVCGTRLCFGADAPAALAGLHAERVLLVTDPYFAENGTAARYAAAFPGAQVEQFSDVAPDPPLSLVAQGVARLQALRPDTVLAACPSAL